MAEVAFRQSLARFLVLLVVPGAATAAWLVRLGLWGLWVFPPAEAASRALYGFGPLLLAASILALMLRLGAEQASVSFRLTPHTLFRRVGGAQEEAWPLDRLYVIRSEASLYPVAHVTDGQRSFRIHAVFLPGYVRFCGLLEAVSRARRRVESL